MVKQRSAQDFTRDQLLAWVLPYVEIGVITQFRVDSRARLVLHIAAPHWDLDQPKTPKAAVDLAEIKADLAVWGIGEEDDWTSYPADVLCLPFDLADTRWDEWRPL